MNSVSSQGIEVRGKCCDQGFTFTSFHFGYPTKMQSGSTHDLDIKVTLPESSSARFANGSKRLRQNIVKHFKSSLASSLYIPRAINTRLKLRGQRAQVIIASAFHFGLKGRDLRNNGFEDFDLSALTRAQNFLK
jgi:hypothetical protein